ncbi:MAG: hypothetical protein IIA51_11505 [Chloroflexi bacterium]|nr:hypothetical protein [Chloroflexota bacterium]
MRPIAAFILSLAMAGMAAAQGLARADICPDGRCPTVGVPGSWSGTGQYAPADLRVDARAIARIRFTSRVKRCSHEQDRIDFEPPRRDLVIESRKAAGRRFGADPACSIVTQHWPALIRWFYR